MNESAGQLAGPGKQPSASASPCAPRPLLLLAWSSAAGLVTGGYLDYEGSPWLMLPGKAAGLVGMAAEDINITGLEHHEPEMLLAAIGVAARRLADRLRCRACASASSKASTGSSAPRCSGCFPTSSTIEVKEREPFAIWQRGDMPIM